MADSPGNGPQRSSQSRLAAGANTPMAKTIALVVLAIIVGIVMINIVDDGGTTTVDVAGSTTTRAATSTTAATTNTTTGGGKATTTTVKSNAVIPPAQLVVFVANSGAPAGSGGNILTALKSRGYTNPANDTAKVTWSEKGLVVHCKSGLSREAAALVKALAGVPNYTAKTAAYKTQPGVPAAAQCYVSIGAAS